MIASLGSIALGTPQPAVTFDAVATKSGDREAFFPAIEKKYGQPMSYWFSQMEQVADRKYPEQIAFLKENHGFSQAHANALVMFTRGSTTSKRFATLNQYLQEHEAVKQRTVRAILDAIQGAFPELQLVIAWNKPMLKSGDQYVFGISIAKQHILIAPFNPEVLTEMADRLSGYTVNKKTMQVPVDWAVDKQLLNDMVQSAIRKSKSG